MVESPSHNERAGDIAQGSRCVITGQVGVEKKPFIDRVAQLARQRSKSLEVCHVGDMMYAEAPDVARNRILDLPRSRLNALRRAVFRDILRIAERSPHLIVNTHATFRWRHGLFPAFDYDQMKMLEADVYLTLVDNCDAVHERLLRDHNLPHTLKDILVWREEEIVATELISGILRGYGHFYILPRGKECSTAETVYQLMFEPERRKAYLSFPMTHVMDMPDVLEEIVQFRASMSSLFTVFDPADLEEKTLLFKASQANEQGLKTCDLDVNGRVLKIDVEQIMQVANDIDSQIYARDFKLIDQADMIVSFIPALAGGGPALSSGVERELQHAFEMAKEVYIIWKPAAEPSPFITKTASKVFRSVDEALDQLASAAPSS